MNTTVKEILDYICEEVYNDDRFIHYVQNKPAIEEAVSTLLKTYDSSIFTANRLARLVCLLPVNQIPAWQTTIITRFFRKSQTEPAHEKNYGRSTLNLLQDVCLSANCALLDLFDPHILNHYANKVYNYAVKLDNVEFIKKFVAKLNRPNFSLLMQGACQKGSINIVRYLLDEFPSPPNKWVIAILEASQSKNATLAKLVIDRYPHRLPFSALKSAIQADRLDNAVYLIQKGVGINQLDNGMPPLCSAALKSGVDMCKLLIEHGADKTVKSFQGYTPLHYACKFLKYDLIAYLLTQGYSLEDQILGGMTPIDLFLSSSGSIAKITPILGEKKNLLLHHLCKKPQSFTKANLTIDLLVKYGYDLNSKNEQGQNAFQIAAQHSNVEFIKSIQKTHPALFSVECVLNNINIEILFENDVFKESNTYHEGNTLLHCAILYNKPAIIPYLITKCPADLVRQNQNGDTPLMLACRYKNGEILKHLIIHTPALLYNAAQRDKCPLYLAWKDADLNFISFLCKEINMPAEHVECALLANNLEGIEYLATHHLDALPDIEKILLPAFKHGMEFCIPLFARNPLALFKLPLREGVHNVSFFIKLLKSEAVKEEHVDSEGNNLLHIACRQGSLEVVMLLDATGKFGKGVRNGMGDTPLLLALQNNNLKLLLYLIEGGGEDPHLNFKEGRSPFFTALVTGKIGIACYLHLLNLYEPEDLALEFPIQKGCEAIVADFLTKGASPNVMDVNGEYPLQTAAALGLTGLVAALLEHGAEPNLKGRKGEFPLLIACKNGYGEIAAKLIQAGAYLNVKDTSLEYPITYACKHKQDELALLMLKGGVVCPPETILTLALSNGLYHSSCFLFNQARIEMSAKSLICTCCQGGNTPLLCYLIEQRKETFDPEEIDYMVSAIKGGNLNIVEKLIEYYNKPLDFYAHKGLLHKANAAGAIPIIEYLVNTLHLDPDEKDDKGNIPVIYAAMSGHLEAVRHHVGNRMNFNPVLWAACHFGHLSIVKYFLEELKYNPKNNDQRGSNCLFFAACQGQVEVARYLFERYGFISDEHDNNNMTIVMWACLRKQLEFLKFLHRERKYKFHISEFFYHLINGDAATMDFFLKEVQIDPHSSYQNKLALHEACRQGNKEVVTYLIDNKIFSPETLEGKQTPLHHACLSQNLEIVKYLIKKKCYVQPLDHQSCTPLHIACVTGRKEIAESLVEAGHTLDPQDNSGYTPLHLAIINQHYEVAEFLLSRNCNRDIESKNGETPILLASQKGDKNIICRLLVNKNYSFLPRPLLQDPNALDDVVTLLRLERFRVNPEEIYRLCKIKDEHYHLVDEIEVNVADIPKCDYSKEFSALFAAINFTDPRKSGYIDPDKVADDGVLIKNRHSNVVEALKLNLSTFSNTLKNRGRARYGNGLLAAPPLLNGAETVQRKNFFDTLEFLVGKSVEKMKEPECDLAAKNEHILRFAIAASHCATRYLGEAYEAYESLVLKRHPTIDEKVLKMYTNHRLGIVEELSKEFKTVNLHRLNTYRRLIKMERGIPGMYYEGDPYDAMMQRVTALQKFDEKYTVGEMVRRLDSAINGAAREFSIEEVADWFVDKLKPEEMNRDDFVAKVLMDPRGNVKIPAIIKMLVKLGCIDASAIKEYLDENKYEMMGHDLLLKIDDEPELGLSLIKKGALLNIEDSSGRRALQIAAAEGLEELVGELLKQGSEVNAKDHQGLTALHMASKNGYRTIVGLLLDAGAKADKKNKKKETALHLAAKSGREEIYDLLKEKGADENLLDDQQHTPSYYATLYLKRAAPSTNENPLFEVCKKGRIDALPGLMDLAKVKEIDANGYTPLHHACKNGFLPIVKQLLQLFPVMQPTRDGDTLLHLSCRSQNEALVRYLLEEQKVDPNRYNEKGNTALYTAFYFNNLKNVKVLLEHNVRIDPASYQQSLEIEVEWDELIKGLENEAAIREQLKGLDGRFAKRKKAGSPKGVF